jgi:transcriptional regulator with XRE-family HTH domain
MSAVNLEKWIRSKGLKKSVVAQKLDVSPPTLSKILKGRQIPDIAQAIRIEELTEGFVSIRGWSIPPRTDLTEKPDQCIGV